MNNYKKLTNLILNENRKLKPSDITLDANLKNDLGLDSLDKWSLAVNCEKVFNIAVFDSDIEEFETVKDVIDYINKKAIR